MVPLLLGRLNEMYDGSRWMSQRVTGQDALHLACEPYCPPACKLIILGNFTFSRLRRSQCDGDNLRGTFTQLAQQRDHFPAGIEPHLVARHGLRQGRRSRPVSLPTNRAVTNGLIKHASNRCVISCAICHRDQAILRRLAQEQDRCERRGRRRYQGRARHGSTCHTRRKRSPDRRTMFRSSHRISA